MKINLVKFKNGKYGIRKRQIMSEDLFFSVIYSTWLRIDSKYFPSCKTTEDEARRNMDELNAEYEIIE